LRFIVLGILIWLAGPGAFQVSQAQAAGPTIHIHAVDPLQVDRSCADGGRTPMTISPPEQRASAKVRSRPFTRSIVRRVDR